ncbi:hypothetical protein [Sphingomonas sp.]|uniref:hypothetical protein n=1 Tax=Sphingomonas sp. TaxID=28214 RepID=UPI00261C8F95|nr:hypothetical protein [Sphingomonas sp.]
MKMMQGDPNSEWLASSGLPDLCALLARAWPEGISEHDASLLRKLPREEEELVRTRLFALLEVEAGTRPASRPPEHDPRGLSASGFQSLVRRWRTDRGVQTLLPYAGRRARARDDTPEHRIVVEMLDELLRADPRASLVTISKMALDRSGVRLALNTVRSLARERRSAMLSDPAWLATNYGRHVLADVCALGSTVRVGKDDAAAAIALVVETASGIVLGHVVGPIDDAPALQRSAMAAGLALIVGEGIDVVAETSTALTIVLAPDAPAAFPAAVRRAAPGVTIVDSPRRRHGDKVADLLDGSVDVLTLRPRGGRAARRADSPTWDADRLAMAAQEAVDTHNRVRLARVKDAIPANHLAPFGRMVEVLRPVVDLG